MSGKVIQLAAPARSLPQSAESERIFLGGIMLCEDAELIRGWSEILPSNAFYSQQHTRLWNLMVAMVKAGNPVSMVDVCERIAQGTSRTESEAYGGLAYVSSLADNGCPTSAGLEHYARIIAGMAHRRDLIFAARELEDAARDTAGDVGEAHAVAERILSGILKGSSQMSGAWLTMLEAVGAQHDVLQERVAARREGRALGMASPWSTLDGLIGPMSRGNLTIIAARPGMGKTGLALELTRHIAETIGPVALISLEMPTGQLLDRQIANLSRVWQSKIRDGEVNPFDWQAMVQAMNKLSEMPVLLSDAPVLKIDHLPGHVRQACARAERAWCQPLAVVVLDYLQLVRGDGRSREEEVGRVARLLKGEVARGFNVHVIALAQLSRKPEERRDKRPQLQDLRESGAVEQEADAVILPFRREVYRGQGVFSDGELSERDLVELIVAKARHGTCGSAWLRWDLQRNQIREELDCRGWPS